MGAGAWIADSGDPSDVGAICSSSARQRQSPTDSDHWPAPRGVAYGPLRTIVDMLEKMSLAEAPGQPCTTFVFSITTSLAWLGRSKGIANFGPGAVVGHALASSSDAMPAMSAAGRGGERPVMLNCRLNPPVVSSPLTETSYVWTGGGGLWMGMVHVTTPWRLRAPDPVSAFCPFTEKDNVPVHASEHVLWLLPGSRYCRSLVLVIVPLHSWPLGLPLGLPVGLGIDVPKIGVGVGVASAPPPHPATVTSAAAVAARARNVSPTPSESPTPT
jgi:hypothetical protein